MGNDGGKKFRREKAAEHMRRVAAKFLESESNKTTLITVTRASVSKNLKNAVLYITVLPESKEGEALKFARRRLSDFREYLKEKLKFRTLPFFEFEIDKGEKNRVKLDEISKKK